MEAQEQENKRGALASNLFPAQERNVAKAQNRTKSHPLHRYQKCNLPRELWLRHVFGLIYLGFLQKEEGRTTSLVKRNVSFSNTG